MKQDWQKNQHTLATCWALRSIRWSWLNILGLGWRLYQRLLCLNSTDIDILVCMKLQWIHSHRVLPGMSVYIFRIEIQWPTESLFIWLVLHCKKVTASRLLRRPAQMVSFLFTLKKPRLLCRINIENADTEKQMMDYILLLEGVIWSEGHHKHVSNASVLCRNPFTSREVWDFQQWDRSIRLQSKSTLCSLQGHRGIRLCCPLYPSKDKLMENDSQYTSYRQSQ